MAFKFVFIATIALPLAVSQQIGGGDCPGIFFLNSVQPHGACCIGGALPSVDYSSCAGWPTCTGPTTTSPVTTPTGCSTIIPNDGDYSSNIAALTTKPPSSPTSATQSGTPMTAGGGGSTAESTTTQSAPTTSSTSGAVPSPAPGIDMVWAAAGMILAAGPGGAALWL